MGLLHRTITAGLFLFTGIMLVSTYTGEAEASTGGGGWGFDIESASWSVAEALGDRSPASQPRPGTCSKRPPEESQ